MRPVLCLALLGYTVVALPNGYYHQEYNYKTSSSSWKNNELQHKTDDQGYYKKDGDLEGRSRPRIDANSEHSEYVNPNLRANGQYGAYGGAGTDMSSYGHMRSNNDYSYAGNNLAEGVASSDRLMRASGYNAESYGSNSYGSSSSYGVTSNLHAITGRLQQDIEREMNSYVRDQTYSRSLDELEAEIRRRINDKLTNELLNRYGQQTVRGGLSYTIAGGHTQATANYDNRELEDLKMQVENSLLNQLRSQYYQRYGNSASQSYHASGGMSAQSHHNYATYTTTTVRPYQTIYPSLPTYATTPRSSHYNDYAHSGFKTVRYTPVPNPESITNIASRIQTTLDRQLNDMLDEARRRYFSSSANYALTNTDVVLERMKTELRSNLTYLLEEDIRRNYGQQVERDGRFYSMGPDGQLSPEYNYAARDLDNLKYQIERNLVEKLNRDFENYRSRWSSQQTYNGQSNYETNRLDTYSSTPRYEVYTTPRTYYSHPTASSLSSLIAGGGSSGSSNYNYASNYGVKGHHSAGVLQTSSSSNMAELQQRLQEDLSRQLQAAISRGHYGSYGGYSPQNYQSSLQKLQDELHRNLTRQLSEYSASGSYAAYGNYDANQMAALKSQLESSLMSQLQQGLQRSFATHSSYSASSSSSASGSASANYRPVRGFQNYQAGMGQYQEGDDCMGDDPNTYNRHKRSYQPYRSRPLGLGASGNVNYGGYAAHGGYSGSGSLGRDDSDLTQKAEDYGYDNVGQQVDESNTLHVEDSGLGKLQQSPRGQVTGQQIDHSDTQEIGDSDSFKPEKKRDQYQIGQQVDESDTQQIEDSGFDNLARRGQYQANQQLQSHSQVGQQVQEAELGRLQRQNQLQTQSGQQVDDTDTQQIEESGFDNPARRGQYQANQQLQSHSQQVDDTDTQQIEESGLERLQVPRIDPLVQPVPDTLGQQVDDTETQQIEDSGFGNLESENQIRHTTRKPHVIIDLNASRRQRPVAELGQQVDDSDPTQQVEEQVFGKTEPAQYQVDEGQVEDNSDLQQHVGGNPNPGSQIYNTQKPKDIDVIVNELQRDISRQIQDEVDIRPISSNNHKEIQQLINQLENSINVKLQNIYNGGSESFMSSRKLSEEQLNYLKNEVQSYIMKELEKRYGRGIRVTTSWNRSDSTSRSTGIMQNTYAGFENNNNFRDFTNEQIQKCQITENELLQQLQGAIRMNVQLGNLNGASKDTNFRKIQLELHNNITKEIENLRQGPYSHLFSIPGINRIQLQLESDLNKYLQQEVDRVDSISVGSLTRETPVEEKREVTQYPKKEILAWNLEGFSTKQSQFCQYLEDTITKKLKDAVKINDVDEGSHKPSPHKIYQQLTIELPQMIDERLTSFSKYFMNNYMSFDEDRLSKIKEQLTHNLKIKLQRELNIENEVQPESIPQPNIPEPQDHELIEPQNSENELTQQAEENPFHKNQGTEEITQDTAHQQNEGIEPARGQIGIPTLSSTARVRPLTDNIPMQAKPVNNNQFLQTEIDSQQRELQDQRIFGSISQNLEPPKSMNENQSPFTNNLHNPLQGQQYILTSQGQYVVQPQTRDEAEQTADQLINRLREAQNSRAHGSGYNSDNQDTYSSNRRDNYYDSPPRSYPSGNTYGDYSIPTDPSRDSYRYKIDPRQNFPTLPPRNLALGNPVSNQYTGFPLSTESLDTFSQTPVTFHQLNYGQQQDLNHNFEIAGSIEPLQPAKANEVQTLDDISSKPQMGVKGGRRVYYQNTYTSTPEPASTSEVYANVEEVSPVNPSAEELSWWKRFGQKVKQGAKSLKEKIVG